MANGTPQDQYRVALVARKLAVEPTVEAPAGLCRWCESDRAIASHALKKRSQGGEDTIPLCYPCDIWFDENHANLVIEGDFLVATTMNGDVLGKVPLRPIAFSASDLAGESWETIRDFALRAQRDALCGAIAEIHQAEEQLTKVLQILCYAFKVRDGWRPKWYLGVAQRITALTGVTIDRSTIYQHAQNQEMIELNPAVSKRADELKEIPPSAVSLAARARDRTGDLTKHEAQAKAVNILLENAGASVRGHAANLQDAGLLGLDTCPKSLTKRHHYTCTKCGKERRL